MRNDLTVLEHLRSWTTHEGCADKWIITHALNAVKYSLRVQRGKIRFIVQGIVAVKQDINADHLKQNAYIARNPLFLKEKTTLLTALENVRLSI